MIKKRNSSIELLKVIAIILIILSHCAQSVEKVQNVNFISSIASNNTTFIILNILMCCGQIGNIIFIICSAYFLMDSNITKKEKVLNMILDTFTISMLWLIPFIFLNIDVSTNDLLVQFAPITYQNNWFIGCYILLYLIHPFLNIIIHKCSQKQLLRICLTMFVLYSCIQFFLSWKYYFNELIGFIYIYFIVSYVKLYMKKFTVNRKINVILLISAILLHLLLILFINNLGLKFLFLSTKVLYWNNLASPLYIILGITLFNLFNNINYYNKFINYISQLSLLIYLIHENMMFRTYIRPLFYSYSLKFCNNILLLVFALTIALFVMSIIIAAIYKKTIQKLIYKISNRMFKSIKYICITIENYIIKIS